MIVGENETFMGEEELLRSRRVEIVVRVFCCFWSKIMVPDLHGCDRCARQVLNDATCKELMSTFIATYPSIWNEDIGVEDAH